jgi:hypothetical protein
MSQSPGIMTRQEVGGMKGVRMTRVVVVVVVVIRRVIPSKQRRKWLGNTEQCVHG